MVMRCAECGHSMERMEGVHKYDECGLKNIHLLDIPMYKCTSCGETEVEIPAMEELHLLLGLIVVYQAKELSSDDVRYLRKHMTYSQEELASKLGVARASVARWEASGSNKPIKLTHDLHLRRFYLEKKGREFDSFTNVHRILSAILDKVLTPSKTNKIQIRKDDWMTQQEEAACLSTL